MRVPIALFLAFVCALNVFAALTNQMAAPVNWAIAVFIALLLLVYVEYDWREP